jgi:hypothetical protein
MSDAGEVYDCRICGRTAEGSPDYHGVCAQCRAEVVRRSTRWALLPAAAVAALYVWLLTATGMFESRFMVVWVALGVALAYVAFKIARRVLFDVIRSRGVRLRARKSTG